MHIYSTTVCEVLIAVCAGLANIAGICDSRRRTAINHDGGEYASIQTAAHELAHKYVLSLTLTTTRQSPVVM